MKKALIILALMLTNFSFANDLDKKIGQMIIIGFSGDNINSRGFKNTLKQIKKGEISGIIYFSHNIKSKNDLMEMNKEILSSNEITPFISIDNEGGMIQRHSFINNKSAKEIASLNESIAKEEYSSMAELLKELGFNLNFAPCVDLEINQESIIKKKERSYGSNPKIVSKYSKIFIEEHNKKGIITSIKHFPGHGSVKGDTHKGFVDATSTFQKEELIPYNDLKNEKLNMVMVSHIFNSNIDSNMPASLSFKTINELLIKKIGFNGVIISDDYDMRAIRDNYSLREIAINSINSGVNILLFSNNIMNNDRNLTKKLHKIIKQEIKKGNIKEQNIENSYNKILELKKSLSN